MATNLCPSGCIGLMKVDIMFMATTLTELRSRGDTPKSGPCIEHPGGAGIAGRESPLNPLVNIPKPPSVSHMLHVGITSVSRTEWGRVNAARGGSLYGGGWVLYGVGTPPLLRRLNSVTV